MVAMFSPIGVKSFVHNFPEMNNDNILIAAFGASTQAALKSAKLKTYIPAPTNEYPSMVMAMDKFLSLTPEEREEWMKEIDILSKKRPARKTANDKTTSKKTAASKTKTVAKPKAVKPKLKTEKDV